MLKVLFRPAIATVFSSALLISSLGTATQAATQKSAAPTTVTTNSSSPVVLDSAGSIEAPEYQGGRGGNNGLLFSPDGNFLYAQTYSYLLKVDLASFVVKEKIDLNAGPVVSTTSPDRQNAYVITGDNPQLEVFNLATGVVSSDPPIVLSGAGAAVTSPTSITSSNVPSVGTMIFVYSSGNTYYQSDPQIHAIDITTGNVTALNLRNSLGTPRGTYGYTLAVSANGEKLYLSKESAASAIYEFNTADFVTNPGVLNPVTLPITGGLLNVYDDDPTDATNLGKIYALDDTGSLRIIDAATGTLETTGQLSAAPRAFKIRSNGDVAATYSLPKIDYYDLSADAVVSKTFPLIDNDVANAIAVAFDENSTYGTCIFTANNYDASFSAVGVDGADCGPFSNRIGSIAPTIEVNGSASINITPPSNTSREKPWVGIGVFVDGVLDRVIKSPFASSINLVWADLAPGNEVSIRSYSQDNLDESGLTTVDEITNATGYLHERTTRLGYLGFEAESIAAGGEHSCAVFEGSVYCWGANDDGQLGDSTDSERAQVTKVEEFADLPNASVTQVVTGDVFSCALRSGSVYCWGSNDDDQLGSDTDGDSVDVPTKVEDVVGGFQNSNVTAISAGADHACAIAGGSVYCWGANGDGHLGDGTQSNSFSAVKVSPVQGVFTNTGVTAIATGFEHSCAIAGGSVYCWGSNGDGQLGDGTSNSSSTAIKVGNVSGVFTNANVTAVSAGDTFTCAIASGVAYCWGSDSDGKLGNGENSDSTSSPERVVNEPVSSFINSNVTQIKTGEDHACLVKGGVMFCWGSHGDGRLGVGPDGNDSHSPLKVSTVQSGFPNTGVTSFSLGASHTCAISAGKAYCWGDGYSGRIGNGSTSESDAFIPGKVCCKVQSSNPSPSGATYNAVPKQVGPNQKFKPVKNANGLTLKLKSSTTKVCRVVGQQIVFGALGKCRVTINQGSSTLKTINTEVTAGMNPKGSVAKISASNVYFAGNSAVLSSTAKADLRKLVSKLKVADVVTVSGHSAYTGFFSSRSYAKTLSEKRADVTAKYLRSLGVKVSIEVAYGSSAQVSKSLSKNRRVEIAWL